MVKNLWAVQETQGQSLSWEDPQEQEMAIHSSILALENSMDRSLAGFSPRDHEDGASRMLLVLLEEFPQSSLAPSRTGLSPEPDHAGPLIWDVQLSQLEEIHFSCALATHCVVFCDSSSNRLRHHRSLQGAPDPIYSWGRRRGC